MSVINTVCIPQNPQGGGGLSGGQGFHGQTSQVGQGFAARSYGIPVIKTTTGINAEFRVRLTKDLLGTVPADLTYVSSTQLVCRCSTGIMFTEPCEDDGTGFLTVSIKSQDVQGHPGLFYAAFICYDQQQKPVKQFPCCIQVLKGITDQSANTPLTVEQVRMQAYDMSAQKNQLLDDLQFSDIQIIYAIRKAVDDWNQMPPTLANAYTPETFPFRSHLCTGAIAHLYRMAAYRYTRNQMRHSNAGLTFDDNDKAKTYAQLSAQAMQEWNTWVQTKKSQLNQMQCMGTLSDGYFENYHGWLW